MNSPAAPTCSPGTKVEVERDEGRPLVPKRNRGCTDVQSVFRYQPLRCTASRRGVMLQAMMLSCSQP